MRSLCLVKLLGLLLVGMVAAGCESKAGTGALLGGALGAAGGAAVGSLSHSRAGAGALIGAAIGAGTGAIVGNEMDKKDERDRQRAYDSRYGQPRYADSSRYSAEQQSLTPQDVMSWSSHGMREDEMIDRIEHSGTIFRLTAADENRLRDAGVAENVIRAMRDTARR